ncbi:MAG: methyltransferase domain-containing protein [Tepidisphaeraceae bacterium]
MPRLLHDQRIFWRQFRKQFHTTGAIAPSGRFLGKALAHFVANGDASRPRRILEVGPGTGAVTTHICRAMKPNDSLDMVELNDDFVRRLNERLASEHPFKEVASRSRVLHCRVEALSTDEPYDVIVSGLPLNNFAVADVEQILGTLKKLLKPGGTLSFFEYVAIRSAKAVVGKRSDRERLRGIGKLLRELLSQHEIRRDMVLPNVPPAWVHHVRIDR